MGHHINALIGSRHTLAKLIDRFGTPEPTEVKFGLVIVPLDDRRLDEIGMWDEQPIGDFCYLKQSMADEMGRWLGQGRALYIETDYFGGMGSQHAAVFENGKMLSHRSISTFAKKTKRSMLDVLARMFSKPQTASKSPISEGLAELGVEAEGETDEFDALGLGEFRMLEALGCYNDDWDEK
ncbi:MAG: hypothetical protein AAFZ11_12760 [Pseudomonadota bacterium]